MVDAATLRALVAELPETADESTEDGTLRFVVCGKQFAWTYPERIEEKKPRVPNPSILVVRCPLDEKEALLTSDAEKYFTVAHYDGYPAVLVRIAAVGKREMRELLEEAWRTRAPKRLLRTL